MKVTLTASDGEYIFNIDDCEYSEFDKSPETEMTEIDDLRKSIIEAYFKSGLETFYEGKHVMNLCGGAEIRRLYKKIKMGFETGAEEVYFCPWGTTSFVYWPDMVEVKK